MLSISNLSIKLGDFSLRNVSLDVSRNEYVVLLGASGVGKTVLLEAVTGLLQPDSGAIRLDGDDITNRKIQKRGIGLVYQDQTLFPHMTVFSNIAYGLKSMRIRRSEIERRVRSLAEQTGVEHLLQRKPVNLSGGEAQRVALARTLAMEPKCLLMDEPVSALDKGAQAEMRRLLRNLHRDGQTIVHVTHNYEEAVALATKVAIMEEGTIVQTGTVEEVFQHPKSSFVAEFMGIRNFFHGMLHEHEDGTTSLFATGGITLSILTDQSSGPGYAVIRSEDVTVSMESSSTSARNEFQGRIIDIEPAHPGMEVIVDIGLQVSALVTPESVRDLGLEIGKSVWIDFKASAVKFFGAN